MSVNKKKDNFNLSQWISGEGPKNDIVLSSRVRLARNLQKVPYPNNAGEKDLMEVEKLTRKVISSDHSYNFHYLSMNDLPDVEKQLLVEKNLTSPVHIQGRRGKGLLLNDKENISIMVNEEDHLRIQVLLPGLQLEKAWEKADKIDDLLEEELNFAYSKKWGYLSACPTNLGTGLRASIMIHLPALNMTSNINKMLGAVSQLGLVVRGIYGEGSDSAGNIYQISNQITLGNMEEDIIDNLKSVTTQIIEEERNARSRLLQDEENTVRDKVMRAYGILKYAYKISSEEAMKLLSNISLGIDMGIIDDINPGILSELLILIRPAHLQKNVGKEISPEARDIKRASLIQDWINV